MSPGEQWAGDCCFIPHLEDSWMQSPHNTHTPGLSFHHIQKY